MNHDDKLLGSRAVLPTLTRRLGLHVYAVLACGLTASALGQTTSHAQGGAGVSEPAAKIAVDPPAAESLSAGVAVVRYRAENLRVAPIFGPDALTLSPRVGHIHVRVDNTPWVWAYASAEPVVIAGLTSGTHEVRLQLMNANHQWLDEGAVNFIVPQLQRTVTPGTHRDDAVVSSAKILIDSPVPEPLSRGVVFIRYRTENLKIGAMAGPARSGHIKVRVDDASWWWADASGNPVIVQGLAPGRHKILIQLADPDDHVVDQGTVDVTIAASKK